MDKAGIMRNLKANNYSFEDKEDQVIVKLERRYFLKLYIENDHVVKNEDMVKQFGLLVNGKSLKNATKINVILSWVLCILSIFVFCIFEPYFFTTFAGKFLLIGFAFIMLWPLLEFWNYNNRLSKIKKLLHLND